MNIADTNQPSLPLGDGLLEAGWRQGTMFSATSVCFAVNKLSDLDANEPVAIVNVINQNFSVEWDLTVQDTLSSILKEGW